MLDKRAFPLVVLKDIEKFKTLIKSPFVEGSTRDILVHVVDCRTQGRFWFRIDKIETEGARAIYQFSRYPGSTISVGETVGRGEINTAMTSYNSWTSICQEYEEIDPFDDISLKREVDQFFSEFEILDDDANTSQFTEPQKLYISEALTRISGAIASQSDESISIKEKTDLLDGVEELRGAVDTQTKNGFIKKLGKFIVVAKRKSLKIGTWILTEFIKELIKEGVKKGIQMDPSTISLYLEGIGLS